MRKGGGKQKGAGFERQVCKHLSLWVSGGVQEDVFWRSAMSGGRSTLGLVRAKRLAAQAGDISCIHPVGQPFADKFLIECKTYRDLKFSGLFKAKPTGNLAEFWKLVRAQAVKYGKHPMLIAKQNQMPEVVCVDDYGLAEIGLAISVVSIRRLHLHVLMFHELLQLPPPGAKRPSDDLATDC